MQGARGRALIGALAAVLCLSSAAGAQRASPIWRIGAFTMGMTYDDARAAAPELKWMGEGAPGGVLRALFAANAVTIHGTPFNVRIEASDDAYTILLDRFVSVQSSGECRDQAIALVGELETHYGQFGKPQSELATSAVQDDVKAGASSRLLIFYDTPNRYARRDENMDWEWDSIAKDAPRDYAITAAGEYFSRAPGDWACTATVRFEYQPRRR